MGEVTSVDFGLAPAEHVFGLGDKVRGFDRRGSRFELWNTDAYGWKVDADPLYKSIPFLLMLREGRAYGLFIDNPARAQVDVGSTRPDTLSYTTTSEHAFDIYLFAGGEPTQVLEAYTISHKVDVLVMGAYGNARWREFILGGATKSLLSKPPLPILFSH